MRKFSSYGPINPKLHFHAPREKLIETGYVRLVGQNPEEGGHYITVWAPRQCGKTWIMQQILFRLRKEPKYDVLKINLEHLKFEDDPGAIISTIAREIGEGLNKELTNIDSQQKFQGIFRKGILEKPLILIMDEFDSLKEEAIGAIVSAFRNIHIKRMDEPDKTTGEKSYLLHGVSLIGVRSVLGIENERGSPFNVQNSMHIPNLTFDEVTGMFRRYEKESGQTVNQDVVEALFSETRGQPGLTSWMGELLTETYNHEPKNAINIEVFEEAYAAATFALPNTNILNLISKAKKSPYKEAVLELFKTEEKIVFKFDDPETNYLYINGVVDMEKVGRTEYFVRFSCPFVQKRLFNYFSGELFDYMGRLVEPFENLDNVFTPKGIELRNLIRCYEGYLAKNREWLFRDAPRRKDLRIYEAVYHFNLYMYLFKFLNLRGGTVYPEFPTGNGKIDLVIEYQERTYGLELKSFSHEAAYKDSLQQAAKYGKQLGLKEIGLVFFVEAIDDKNRAIYEKDYPDTESNVTVLPVFVQSGT